MFRADCGRLFLRRQLVPCLAGMVIAAGVCGTPGQVNGKDPDLAEIAQKLKRWRSSFVTMRLVWVLWNPEHVKNKHAATPSPEDIFTREQFDWIDAGAARRDTWGHKEGRQLEHVYEGGNARTRVAFRAMYPESPERPGFLSELDLVGMPSPEPKTSFSVTPLQDIYRGFEARWLGDRLAQGNGKLEGYEELDGVRCARVTIDYAALWLDTTHDFLVRRVRPPSADVAGVRFDVEEYQRVPPGIWFPKRGTHSSTAYRTDDTVGWLVTEVALNESIPSDRFDPPAPMVGTHVVDRRSGKSYVFGEKRAGDLRENAIAAQAEKNLSESESVFSVHTGRWGILSWSAMLLCGSVVLLLIGIVIAVRRRFG